MLREVQERGSAVTRMTPDQLAKRLAPLLFILSVALVGCAQYARYDWTKAGATDEQFYRDSRECALEASPPRSGAEKIRVSDDLYNACLVAHGYRRNTYVPPPLTDWRGWLGE